MPQQTDREVLVTEQIGRTRYRTPEGFLFCEGVRVARTGPQLYAPSEVPDIDPGENRMVVVERDADCLFDPEAVASFTGKPVTIDHPPMFVTPQTWRQMSVGTVLNPRPGEGADAAFLVADLLITDAAAIAAVEAGKREVSCGYDCEREQIKPGLARAVRMRGNHVALVDRARGGPALIIQDGDSPMAKRTVWDRLRTAFKAKDEAAFNEELEAAESEMKDDDEPQKLVIEVRQPEAASSAEEPNKDGAEGDDPMAKMMGMLDTISAGMTALAERIAKLEVGRTADGDDDKKDEDEDKSGKAMDSAALQDAFLDTKARAEILAPGIRLPAFDAKTSAETTRTLIADLQREALAKAAADSTRKAHVVAAIGADVDPAKLTADALPVAFRAASELARAAHNAGQRQPVGAIPQGPMTPARYQEMIAKRRTAA